MFYKLFSSSSTKYYFPFYPLDSLVLPLFIDSKFNLPSISISDAIEKLRSYIRLYFKASSATISSDLSDKIDFYFQSIKDKTLYTSDHLLEIEQLLCKIVRLISDCSDDSDLKLDGNSKDLLLSLISAIDNQRCFDQHREELKRIAVNDLFTIFDLPIQKFVYFIFHKMESQIKLTFHSWDQNIFRGFADDEPAHSEHIAYILLDELFGIANGSIENESDVLLKKTQIGRSICYKSFLNKLTLEHLFSDGSDNWKLQLAKQLSVGSSSLDSDVKLSLLDILDSPLFLKFLFDNHFLTSSDYEKLTVATDPNHLDTVEFELPFLKYSDSLDHPEIVFNELFIEYLISYVYHQIHLHFGFNTQRHKLQNQLFDPIHPSIADKLINQYVLCISPKVPFSSSEISDALSSPVSSEYHLPFLKSFLRVSSLMISYCNPDDALDLFNAHLKNNVSKPWVFDCLCLMLTANPEAAIKIPLNTFLSVRNNLGDSAFHIATIRYPEVFFFLVRSDWLTLDSLFSIENNKNETPIHWLSQYNPRLLLKFIDSFDVSILSLANMKDFLGNTIFHWLPDHHPAVFSEMLIKGRVSIDLLNRTFNVYGLSPLFFLAICNPVSFCRLIIQGYLDPLDMSEINQSPGITVFHHFATYNPKALHELIFHNYLTDLHLSSLLDIHGNPILHHLATFNPDILYDLIVKERFSLDFLSSLKDHYGCTTYHWLCERSPNVMLKLIAKFPGIIDYLYTPSGKSSYTALHSLSQNHPKDFIFLIEKKLLSIDRLCLLSTSDDGSTPFHLLVSSYPEFFYVMITLDYSFLNKFINVQDRVGNSVFHILAQNDPVSFAKLFSLFYFDIESIKKSLNNEGKSPFDIYQSVSKDFQ